METGGSGTQDAHLNRPGPTAALTTELVERLTATTLFRWASTTTLITLLLMKLAAVSTAATSAIATAGHLTAARTVTATAPVTATAADKGAS